MFLFAPLTEGPCCICNMHCFGMGNSVESRGNMVCNSSNFSLSWFPKSGGNIQIKDLNKVLFAFVTSIYVFFYPVWCWWLCCCCWWCCLSYGLYRRNMWGSINKNKNNNKKYKHKTFIFHQSPISSYRHTINNTINNFVSLHITRIEFIALIYYYHVRIVSRHIFVRLSKNFLAKYTKLWSEKSFYPLYRILKSISFGYLSLGSNGVKIVVCAFGGGFGVFVVLALSLSLCCFLSENSGFLCQTIAYIGVTEISCVKM